MQKQDVILDIYSINISIKTGSTKKMISLSKFVLYFVQFFLGESKDLCSQCNHLGCIGR